MTPWLQAIWGDPMTLPKVGQDIDLIRYNMDTREWWQMSARVYVEPAPEGAQVRLFATSIPHRVEKAPGRVRFVEGDIMFWRPRAEVTL